MGLIPDNKGQDGVAVGGFRNVSAEDGCHWHRRIQFRVEDPIFGDGRSVIEPEEVRQFCVSSFGIEPIELYATMMHSMPEQTYLDIDIDKAFGKQKRKILEALEEKIERDHKNIFMRDKSVTMGKLLMTNIESYRARFDFTDPSQISRAERYCGRSFETGQPLPKPTAYINSRKPS